MAGVLLGKSTTVAARDSLIFVGDASDMGFRVLSAHGLERMRAHVPSFPLGISREEYRAERDAYLDASSSPRRRAIFDAMPERLTRPAYVDVVVDSEGFYWLGEYVTRERVTAPRGWEVFGPDGRWMGRVEMPARFEPTDIGSDFILGVATTEEDVEHLQLLTLWRGSPQ